jgi:hypothetical protein
MHGVVYDTGMVVEGQHTRPEFDQQLVAREMHVIAGGLHADAVRITGDDLGRLAWAVAAAYRAGLAVWLSPFLYNRTGDEFVEVVAQAGRMSEQLRLGGAETVFVTGCEMTLYGSGFLTGATLWERMSHLAAQGPSDALRCANEQAAEIHPRLVHAARESFAGPITYAAGLWEDVDWRLYDRVGVNAYRDAGNARDYRATLSAYRRWGKPVAVTEFGCATYAGAADLGPAGALAIDLAADPPRLRPGTDRDEQEQVRYFGEVWDVVNCEDIDDAFWFTFAGYALAHTPRDPIHDVDTAYFGLVSMTDDPSEQYPGTPWRRKASFHAVAEAFREVYR